MHNQVMESLTVLSVTQLNQQVKYLLEQSFPAIWVEGEISNFASPGSGHWYLSLKDEGAQIRCAMFKGNNRAVKFDVRNGVHVLVKARVSLYQSRGDFQLIIEEMQEAGVGKLQRQFEALKKELAQLGWFDEESKKAIPTMPETIGVVTSATGAAIRDVLRVLQRRYCNANIIIYPTLVQGNEAAAQIAAMIKTANQRAEADVLLVVRGGGSLEDLWAFNEKPVAEAIYHSDIPVISGVGHQIDFTIADFVADLRAATPSAAAEIVSPDQSALKQQLKKDALKLRQLLQQLLQQQQQTLDWLQGRLKQSHPQYQLQAQHDLFDALKRRLQLAQQNYLTISNEQLSHLQKSLQLLHPKAKLERCQQSLSDQQKRLQQLATQIYRNKKQQFSSTIRALNAVSPLATLERGYAVVKKAKDEHVVTDAKQLKINDSISVRLHKGQLDCEVKSISKESS